MRLEYITYLISIKKKSVKYKAITIFLIFSSLLSAQNNSVSNQNKLESPLINLESVNNIEFSTSTPNFQWNKIQNSNGYVIYLTRPKGIGEENIFISSEYGNITLTEFEIPKNILLEDENYIIRMRAFNEYGWSDYSDPINFKIIHKLFIEKQKLDLPAPTIISKNNLMVDSLGTQNEHYSLVWANENGNDLFQIIIDGINSSSIFGEEYTNIVSRATKDTVYQINPFLFTEFNNYRWRIRSKGSQGWSRYSPYYYFNLNEPKNDIAEVDSVVEELILRIKYAGYIDEMIVAKYKNGNVYYPIIDMLELLQINHNNDGELRTLTGNRIDGEQLFFSLDIKKHILTLGSESIELNTANLIEEEFGYYVDELILEKITGMNVEFNMNKLVVDLTTEYLLPVVQRKMNEQKLSLAKNYNMEEVYPLLFERKRNYLNGGFLDYSTTVNYTKNRIPYYQFQYGIGAELFGGDFQVNSNQNFMDNRITYNQFRCNWRYVFLKNKYISNVSLGDISSFGLQSYNFRGIKISNSPIEIRRIYGSYKIEEKTKPLWKIEIYHNKQLVDIVEADAKGNYSFLVPFSYGTTLLELHEIGSHGEQNIKSKLYQIPTTQVPRGKLDYFANFGKISNSEEYIFQTNAAYGINNWLTTEIGSDIFIDKFNSSAIYSNTTARFLDGYIANIKLAPNAYYELSLNTIYANQTSFNLSAKLHDQNQKLNPSKTKSEFVGNLFLPVKLDQNMLSFLARAKHSSYSNNTRSDFSLRTFYSFNSISPSVEFNYYNLDNGITNFNSSFLNFRVNYLLYLPSQIFSGNIVDARFSHNIKQNRGESFSLSVSTTIYQKFRVQITHTNNFYNSSSDTQLRVVFDLPFFRSNSTISRSVMSQSIIGSINYNDNLKDFNFYNRGMLGRAAATFRFFVDKNMNNKYDSGEKYVSDMDISISSIGTKRIVGEGNLTINDLESYSKYEVNIIEKKNKNPLWFPTIEKFSFIADPHQYKEIEIPFYEAAEVFGSVFKKANNNKVPVSGIFVLFENIKNKNILKIRTMSDGSYYHYGVQPGEYKIYLDDTQTSKLNLKSNPKIIESSIQSISLTEEETEYNFIIE